MTFFRSVATDLRGEVAILVVGFTGRPAIEVLQAASLYQGRMVWFDHHEWPPEDLEAIRRTLGEESVHVEPGLDSPLPMVVEQCTRRSRFTDKLVDLATARFTEHDFTRWGRLWWSRIGTLCERGGDRRGDIEGLLAGRPSDLAREASRHEAPPLPPELAWVSDRDFVLQHFGGYTLVQVPVEEGLNVHLAGRIARERHAAELSLAWMEGDDLMVLGGEDRFDLLAMASHLATKQEWIEALPGNDHVARIRVRDLAEHLDDVVAEIAMGRSILDG